MDRQKYTGAIVKSSDIAELKTLSPMFSLSDAKCIINMPFPFSERAECSADGLNFKLIHEMVGHNRTDGRTHGCSLDLFINFCLGRGNRCFQAELLSWVMYRMNMDVLMWSSVSCSNFIFDDGDGWVHWYRFK